MAVEHQEYLERLEEIRKTCDLYPWIEVLRVGPAPTDAEAPAPFTPYTFQDASWRRSYSMIVRELGLFAMGTAGDGGGYVSDLPVDFQFELEGVRQQSIPILSRSALGDLDRGWHGFPEGLYLPKQTRVDFEITTRGRVFGKGYVYLVARGYRLYPKGIVSPPQMTKEEHREQGVKLVPWTYSTKLTLQSDTGDRATVNLLVTDDFLATGVRSSAAGTNASDAILGPQENGALHHALEMRLKTDRDLMNGSSARMLVAGPSRANEWRWDLPVTIASGTEVEIEVKLGDTAAWSSNGEDIDVEVMLPGYKLVRER